MRRMVCNLQSLNEGTNLVIKREMGCLTNFALSRRSFRYMISSVCTEWFLQSNSIIARCENDMGMENWGLFHLFKRRLITKTLTCMFARHSVFRLFNVHTRYISVA